jgi:hypothetical protein
MTPQDPFERWMTERRKPGVPAGFADGVMRAIRAEAARRAIRRPTSLTVSALVATGSLTLALVWHLTLIGALVLAVAETAH